jgi:DNA gyrase subunit A
MISRNGQCIRFQADTVPEMGRASAGVKGMKLDDDDQLLLACPIANSDQVLLFTERGYAKRLMGAMFDVQGRAGKGVKCVSFNKSGSTGTYVGAAARITASRPFTVLQNGGLMTPMISDELACQNLADKGKPTVMAVLDDVVMELIL